MVKNGRNPTQYRAGQKGKETPYYIVTIGGNKHFFPCVHQLLKASLAGVV
jgi:hypothetical protein